MLLGTRILIDVTHPLRCDVDSRLVVGVEEDNFLIPIPNTIRYKSSFLPPAVTVFNDMLIEFDLVDELECVCVWVSG